MSRIRKEPNSLVKTTYIKIMIRVIANDIYRRLKICEKV